jgi:hypothetical protein
MPYRRATWLLSQPIRQYQIHRYRFHPIPNNLRKGKKAVRILISLVKIDRVLNLWTGADAKTVPSENFVKVKDDLRYAKYFRMVKMGVPAAAVKVRHSKKGKLVVRF